MDEEKLTPRPWIRIIDEADSSLDPELAELYSKIRDPRGHIDNIMRIHSLNPPSLAAHFNFYKLVMYGPSPLTRIQREMIGVVVSSLNRCGY